MTYLVLKPTARFVRGPRRSALYDLPGKRIFPLDAWSTTLVAEALEGRGLEEILESLGVPAGKARRLVFEALAGHPLLRVSQGEPAEAALQAGPSGIPNKSSPAPARTPPGRAVPSLRRLPMAPPAAVARHRRLEFLWLELTERCNLRCVHCYAGSGPGLEDGPMGTREHLRILRQAAQAGCRRVQFNGGEATLHAGFQRLVQEAMALGYERIEVYTNATQLNDERVSFLREHGVRVAVSFYSHREEVHESITRVPGSFRRTVAAIKALLAAGVPVRVGLIRMRPNQDDVPATLDFLAALGVAPDAVGMDDVRPAGRGCGDSLVPSGGRARLLTPPTGTHMSSGTDGELGCSTCWSGKVAVAPSGDVFPCIFSRELPAGNVLRSGLAEVLEGETLQDLWSIDKAQIPVCRDCEFRYGCFDCRALAFKQTQELRSKPPSCAYDPYTGTWGEPGEGGEGAALPEGGAVPVRARGLRWARAGEVALLYSAASQALVTINRVAAEVWRLCDGRRSLLGIARRLSRRYRVPEAEVTRDVRALARELAGLGLVELRAA